MRNPKFIILKVITVSVLELSSLRSAGMFYKCSEVFNYTDIISQTKNKQTIMLFIVKILVQRPILLA